MVFDANSSSLWKNQNISLCRIFAASCGYLANATCICTALHHSPTHLSPCLRLVSKSNLALTSLDWGLQNSSNFSHITSRTSSLFVKFWDTYWSIPKSPLQAITFLHFLASANIASSQSNIFSHLIFHFRNLKSKLSFTVLSTLGPSIYGIYIGCTTCCVWLVDGWNCGVCITTSSSSELESCDGLEFSGNSFVLVTQAYCLVALGILRLWYFSHRSLPSKDKMYKYYINCTSYFPACKLDIHMLTLKTLEWQIMTCTLLVGLWNSFISGPIPYKLQPYLFVEK